MVEVELCVDSAGIGVSDNVHFVLEERTAVDPDVNAVETVVGSGTFRLVRSPNSDVEATEYGNRVFGGAKARGFVAEVDLVWGFGAVDAAVFVDGKQSDAFDGGCLFVDKGDAVMEGIEALLGAGVAHFIMEVRPTAHTAVAGVGYEVATVNGKQSLGHDGVEGVTLMLGLVASDVLGYIAVVTVKVKVDCGYITSMVDVKHFTAVIGGDAETGDIAVGWGVDGSSHTIVATDAEVDAAMEVVGANFGKGSGRSGRHVERVVELGRLERLRRCYQVVKGEKDDERESDDIHDTGYLLIGDGLIVGLGKHEFAGGLESGLGGRVGGKHDGDFGDTLVGRKLADARDGSIAFEGF